MSSADIFSLLQNIQERLNNIEQGLGRGRSMSPSNTKSNGVGVGNSGGSIAAFDAYCESFLNPFVKCCDKLGGDAMKGGHIVQELWLEMRNILLMSTECREPPQSEYPVILSGISNKLKDLAAITRKNEWEKHLKTLNEGVQCVNWLLVKPGPCEFIESYVGASDYWANSVRKEYRTTNPVHIEFCDTFKTLILKLIVYVKENHLRGLVWNASGAAGGARIASPDRSRPPPPPPPATTAAAAPALGSALNKGGDITKGLKKVTKDMQTWRPEYEGEAVPAKKPPPPPAAKGPPAATVKGTPKFEFQQAASKWIVEYQTGAKGVIEVQIQDKRENVYIHGCVGATVNIFGKCKSITIDDCKKTQVLFDNAMASCEIVNSQGVKVQVREKVPAIAIDKTDGIVLYLAETSLDAEIVVSKSSEMNISWPDHDGEMIEKPIPEQYKHHIKDGTITVEVSDLYTH